ncbi:MAG: hypothetical protein ACRD5H_07860 [Nitrososphaerales archaeon]
MENRGIDNEKVQSFIAKAEDPLSEDEIAEGSGSVNTRNDDGIKTKSLKARLTKDVRKWAKNPNGLDVKRVEDHKM